MTAVKKTPRKKQTATAESVEFEHDALVVRTVGPKGESYNNFMWPMEVGAVVECPDWKPTASCGNGFHGLLDGLGDWGLVDGSAGRVWQIVGVKRTECVAIDEAKVKFPRCRLLHVGDVTGAMTLINKAMHERIRETVAEAVKDAKTKTATGEQEHASAAGSSGHASAAGSYGHASAAGYKGHASAAGDSGHASAAGRFGIAAALGIEGTAKAGPDGAIVLAYWRWNGDAGEYQLVHVRAAKVGGPEGIEVGVTYRLDEDGNFIKINGEN